MSSEERDIILQMVAEGKVSTSEAADLLDALDTKAEGEDPETAGEASFLDFPRRERDLRRQERDARRREHDSRRGRAVTDRCLLIQINDGEDTRTHVQIPLGLAVAAKKFLPKRAQDYFDQYGIDLTDLIDSVSNDLSRHGDIVNIKDGDTKVQVAII